MSRIVPAPTIAAELAVVRFADGWRIIHAGRRWGRFELQAAAVDAALRLARQRRASGRPAEVYVQGWAGELRRVQTA